MKLKNSVPDTLAWVPMLLGFLGALWVVGIFGDSLVVRLVAVGVFVVGVAFGVYVMAPSNP